MKNIGVNISVPFYDELKVLTESGPIWALNEFAIVCERPEVIHKDAQGRLHEEGAMALAYPDGWGIYALWGVRLPEWAVLTKTQEITKDQIFSLKNAEQRAALIRKIGIERFIQLSGANVLNRQGDYELLSVALNDQQCRYLKMKNPSVGIWHVEGVPNECETVEQALHARKPPQLQALPINDETGDSWFQQGDVCVWPKSAKSVRRYPKVLT